LSALALGTGALACSAINASAAYRYSGSAHVIVHRDDWRAAFHMVFYEHEEAWRARAWVDIGLYRFPTELPPSLLALNPTKLW
jgi:hypothetical protein